MLGWMPVGMPAAGSPERQFQFPQDPCSRSKLASPNPSRSTWIYPRLADPLDRHAFAESPNLTPAPTDTTGPTPALADPPGPTPVAAARALGKGAADFFSIAEFSVAEFK